MDKDEAIITDCSIGCAASARCRRGAGKVLACRTHWTPQPRCMVSWDRRRGIWRVGEAGHLGSNAISSSAVSSPRSTLQRLL